MAKTGAASRAAAAVALQQVLVEQRSLNQALPDACKRFSVADADKPLVQAICFGVLRELPSLQWLLSQLLDKPLKKKASVVHYLLLAGIYQLRHMRTAAYGAVSASVDSCPLLRQNSLKGLVNANLRRYQREQSVLEEKLSAQGDTTFNHPGWLLRRLRQHYPTQWQDIVSANQQHPPMWLRVNQRHHSAAAYQALLQQTGQQTRQQAGIEARTEPSLPQALCLNTACDVSQLPGFEQGWVSVQDAAAQYAAGMLELSDGQRVLDACAAPGGKSAHILETADVALTALDIDPVRLERIEQTLSRLSLNAALITADAADAGWWDGTLFDRILVDAPCSATGVIRRHPDIAWLRRDSDIENLVSTQADILDNLWPMLRPGGMLVYATCSVLNDENSAQIARFVQRHPDAKSVPTGPQQSTQGWQLLPQPEGHDGFFYARLRKTVADADSA